MEKKIFRGFPQDGKYPPFKENMVFVEVEPRRMYHDFLGNSYLNQFTSVWWQHGKYGGTIHHNNHELHSKDSALMYQQFFEYEVGTPARVIYDKNEKN